MLPSDAQVQARRAQVCARALLREEPIKSAAALRASSAVRARTALSSEGCYAIILLR